MINLTINNRPVSVSEGTTILDAAKKLGINIPTLCYLNLHDINYISTKLHPAVCAWWKWKGLKNYFPPVRLR